jgi:hypothetical protein
LLSIDVTFYVGSFAFPFDPVRESQLAPVECGSKAGMTGRWHNNRQTLITDLAGSGTGDETIRDLCPLRIPAADGSVEMGRLEGHAKSVC